MPPVAVLWLDPDPGQSRFWVEELWSHVVGGHLLSVSRPLGCWCFQPGCWSDEALQMEGGI